MKFKAFLAMLLMVLMFKANAKEEYEVSVNNNDKFPVVDIVYRINQRDMPSENILKQRILALASSGLNSSNKVSKQVQWELEEIGYIKKKPQEGSPESIEIFASYLAKKLVGVNESGALMPDMNALNDSKYADEIKQTRKAKKSRFEMLEQEQADLADMQQDIKNQKLLQSLNERLTPKGFDVCTDEERDKVVHNSLVYIDFDVKLYGLQTFRSFAQTDIEGLNEPLRKFPILGPLSILSSHEKNYEYLEMLTKFSFVKPKAFKCAALSLKIKDSYLKHNAWQSEYDVDGLDKGSVYFSLMIDGREYGRNELTLDDAGYLIIQPYEELNDLVGDRYVPLLEQFSRDEVRFLRDMESKKRCMYPMMDRFRNKVMEVIKNNERSPSDSCRLLSNYISTNTTYFKRLYNKHLKEGSLNSVELSHQFMMVSGLKETTTDTFRIVFAYPSSEHNFSASLDLYRDTDNISEVKPMIRLVNSTVYSSK